MKVAMEKCICAVDLNLSPIGPDNLEEEFGHYRSEVGRFMSHFDHIPPILYITCPLVSVC